jgi:hypothetical protein
LRRISFRGRTNANKGNTADRYAPADFFVKHGKLRKSDGGKSMKYFGTVLIVILFCCSGCMYHGNLQESHFPPSMRDNKLPIKAFMVFDRTLEEMEFHANNVHFAHGVVIAYNPGLKTAMRSSFEATFQELRFSDKIDLQEIVNYDVIIIPRIQIIGPAIDISVTLKDAKTDDILQVYKSSGNYYVTVPTSVHILGIINVVPFCFLTSPIIIPLQTDIIGKQAETDLASILHHLLGTITDDIKNDRKLLNRFNMQRK